MKDRACAAWQHQHTAPTMDMQGEGAACRCLQCPSLNTRQLLSDSLVHVCAFTTKHP